MCLQLVKKFPAFSVTRRFITAFITASHLSLSWDRSIRSMPPCHFLKSQFNTNLSTQAWVLQVVSFPQVSPPNSVYTSPLPHIFHLTHPSHNSSFDHWLWDSSLQILLQSPVTKSLLGCNICPSILFSNIFGPFITAFTTSNLKLWLPILAVLDVTYVYPSSSEQRVLADDKGTVSAKRVNTCLPKCLLPEFHIYRRRKPKLTWISLMTASLLRAPTSTSRSKSRKPPAAEDCSCPKRR